jgi:hypothetical protein
MFEDHMFEHHMFEDHMFEHSMFGPCGRSGEANAGASMEKEAMNGTAKAPAAATAFSIVRRLGRADSKFSPGFSVLTSINFL